MSTVMFERVENRERKGGKRGREDEKHGGGGRGGDLSRTRGTVTHESTCVRVCAGDCNGHHQLSDIMNVITVAMQVLVQMKADGATALY